MNTQEINTEIERILKSSLCIISCLNNKENRILVSGSFKTATTTLQQVFNCPRTHDIYLKKPDVQDNICVVIFPFRNTESVYKSALFQDITEPAYNYCPFAKGNFLEKYIDASTEEKMEIIKTIDVQLLIEHYKKINWGKNLDLNNEARLNIINKYYDIKIDYYSNDIQEFNLNINNNILRIIGIKNDIIEQNFEELKNRIYRERRDDIKLKNDNVGSEKWYGNKYKEFLELC